VLHGPLTPNDAEAEQTGTEQRQGGWLWSGLRPLEGHVAGVEAPVAIRHTNVTGEEVSTSVGDEVGVLSALPSCVLKDIAARFGGLVPLPQAVQVIE